MAESYDMNNRPHLSRELIAMALLLQRAIAKKLKMKAMKELFSITLIKTITCKKALLTPITSLLISMAVPR